MPKLKTVGGTASDPLVDFRKLEIDGETYNLAYDFNAIADAEKIAECNLLHGISAILFNSMTGAQLRGLFYAALQKAHPKMNIVHAGALIRIDTMGDIRAALLDAYNASLPEASKILDPPDAGGASQPTGDPPTEKSGNNAGPTG